MPDPVLRKSMEVLSRAITKDFDVASLAIEALTQRVEQAEELVRWLALPWVDNDPAFPKADPRTGEPLPGNARLERTWYRIVRGTEPVAHSWGDLPEGAPVIEHHLDPSTGETDRREASAPSLTNSDPGDTPPGQQ